MSDAKTKPAVTIVDLGLGNIQSVVRAFERAGAAPTRTVDASDVPSAERLVVPGQGAFRDGARALRSPLGEAVRRHLDSDKPYLGICLGMQLLFEASEEAPGERGLGFLRGEVKRFRPAVASLKVPHMGWNRVRSRHPLVDDGHWFYFVHSYYCVPRDASVAVVEAEYGAPFCAAVGGGRLFACQFHPEKSQRSGQRLLRRFCGLEV